MTAGIGWRDVRSPTWTFRRARIRADALEDPVPEHGPAGRPCEPPESQQEPFDPDCAARENM